MRTILRGFLALTVGGVVSLAAFQSPRPAPQPPGEWRAYSRDLASTRYSPLDQITAANAATLTPAFQWKPEGMTMSPEYRNESTPIVVNGTMYFTQGATRSVVAIDPATGTTKWTWSLDEGPRARVAPRKDAGRGVAFWTDGRQSRIFTVTPGFQLVAIDAATGKAVTTFGKDGIVDLKLQLGVEIDVLTAAIGNSSPPLVFGDTVVIGPALEVGLRPRSKNNVPGRILAMDAKTGALKWRFNTIPQAGEPGNETWEDESWKYTGNAGAWAPLTLDEARGYLYLPVEAATGDYFGGHRHGNNLYSSTLVCLDIKTGKIVWNFQIVHHDIWDRDNPAAPILADITVGGRRIEAVIQVTKQSYAYVFDRVTGKPVWPIEERAVPKSDVPGEKTSPTQPIPSKPAAFDRQGVTEKDLIDFTPALREEALAAIKPYRLGELFSPPSLAAAPDGTKGTLSLPGTTGGGNWEGASFDPETGILYVGSNTQLALLALEHNAQASEMDYVMANGRTPSVRGLPVIKPPYSRVTAINLNTGDHVWMAPAGVTPANIKNNPALAGIDLPNTGGTSRPVLLATKTLLFVGSSGSPFMLRAHDKATGKVVAEIPLPGNISSVPMSYSIGGRQFIAFWASNQGQTGNMPSTMIALALPK